MFTQFASMFQISTVRPGAGLLARLRAAQAAHVQRRALARMDDTRLADLGLTRHEALAEAARAPWDVPAHWLRRSR